MVAPSIFEFIAMMEKYHPRTALRIQLGQGLWLFKTLFSKFKTSKFHNNSNLHKRRLLMLYIASSASMLYGINLFYDFRNWIFLGFVPIAFENNGCWETQIGQEMIKLTIIDLIVTIAAILVIDFIRAIVVRKCNWYFCCFESAPKINNFDEKLFLYFS